MGNHGHVNGMVHELGMAAVIYVCLLPLVWLIVWMLGEPKLRMRRTAFVALVVGGIGYALWG